MAILLTSKYISELGKNVNTPNVILEFELDGGARKFGKHTGGFNDVVPVVKSVSSFQNKIDMKKGYSTRGEITIVLSGRENFKTLVKDNYLKNRRVVRKDGFLAPGFSYSDYASTYTGLISEWSRKGDELTITVSDDLIDATVSIPEEDSSNTQYIDYTSMNPADIMKDILLTQLEVGSAYVDSAKFESERDIWFNGWKFSRVITEPEAANEYLNELQTESNSFIIHDGEKISFKVFAPPVPGEGIEEWDEDKSLLEDSFRIKSGYKDNFYNRVIVYFDYDESGSDGTDNFDSAIIAIDAASQDASEWNEASTKTIKSKWIRSYKHSQPVNITGTVVYHASKANGAGTGTLTFNKADNTLQWTAPGGSPGTAVELTEDGRIDIYDSDESRFIRALVSTASLPSVDKTDLITISSLGGQRHATALASKLLNLYRDPSATVSFEVDINNVAFNSRFIKPTDFKDITTDEASELGLSSWIKERVMVTSVRPDFSEHRVSVEAIKTKIYRRYGFIAHSGYQDYAYATKSQRERAYIGNAGNNVNNGAEDGYYTW
ncbi:MAG: hypothetical protein HY954_13315 [Deltaproteobacteria bacterium]|nr:hypothetical protein [Deltaproteobacteria bacterium]